MRKMRGLMRIKILTFTLLFGMALSLTACGEKSIQRKNDKIATVTIDGDQYVLTGDFQEVVGSMVENGLNVYERRTFKSFDEDGMFSDARVEKDINYIGASENVYYEEWKEGSLVQSEFWILGSQFDFESNWGITSDSDEKELKELEGFIKADAYKAGGENCVALFVDGEIVDFSEYSDDYKEWFKLIKEEGIYAGMNEPYRMGDTFYQILHYYHQFGIEDIDEFVEKYEKSGYSFEKTVTLQLAIDDTIQKMEEGEATTCSIVSFGLVHEDMAMQYVNFYYDADYDELKFYEVKDSKINKK